MTFRPIGRGLTGAVVRWIDDPDVRAGAIREAWRAVAGDAAARQTAEVTLEERVLRVVLDDPKWRASLEELRRPLLDKLRVALGRDAVRELELVDSTEAQADPTRGYRQTRS